MSSSISIRRLLIGDVVYESCGACSAVDGDAALDVGRVIPTRYFAERTGVDYVEVFYAQPLYCVERAHDKEERVPYTVGAGIIFADEESARYVDCEASFGGGEQSVAAAEG